MISDKFHVDIAEVYLSRDVARHWPIRLCNTLHIYIHTYKCQKHDFLTENVLLKCERYILPKTAYDTSFYTQLFFILPSKCLWLVMKLKYYTM